MVMATNTAIHQATDGGCHDSGEFLSSLFFSGTAVECAVVFLGSISLALAGKTAPAECHRPLARVRPHEDAENFLGSFCRRHSVFQRQQPDGISLLVRRHGIPTHPL